MTPDDGGLPWLQLTGDEASALERLIGSVVGDVGISDPDAQGPRDVTSLAGALARWHRAEGVHLPTGCPHPDFGATVGVGRIVATGEEDDPAAALTGLMVELSIVCMGCGTPLRFRCPTVGMTYNGPARSVDAAELRLPAYTDDAPGLGQGLAGFTVTATNDPERSN